MRPLALLVEDNPLDEELILRAVRKTNVDVNMVVVRDGGEAVDYLFAEGTRVERERPRVVLLDLNLPKLSGLEVLQRIRARTATELMPVVILTSSSEAKDVRRCYGEYANSYVIKPIDFVELCSAMKQVMRYWVTLNEPWW